jgi:hypothetical protein
MICECVHLLQHFTDTLDSNFVLGGQDKALGKAKVYGPEGTEFYPRPKHKKGSKRVTEFLYHVR